MNKLQSIIKNLQLEKHPEGGYFREIYRSNEVLKKSALDNRYSGDRNYSTSIYYLLPGNSISRFHRLKSDETWHFYLGSPLILHCINEIKGYYSIKLGNDLINNEVLQFTIPFGDWFAAEVVKKKSFSLTGCTVAPGFSFQDFELAEQIEFSLKLPELKELIYRFT
jgi:predicted cupin superfamily sugar epimerase